MVEALMPHSDIEARSASRARELEILIARFQAERGGAVLLHGPRGVGKDELVSELVRHAEGRERSVVFQGRTSTVGGGSYQPFAEIIRQVMQWSQELGKTEVLVDPVLADLEPVLHHHEGREQSNALDQKLRFFEATRKLLASVSEHTRPLLVVHDLEHADRDTFELATYLADTLFPDADLEPRSERAGLLLFVVRDDRQTSASARDFVLECEERTSMAKLALRGLDIEALGQYLQSPRLLEKLMAASDGLPKEIDELFDALPANVEQIFERRLAELEPVAQDVLRALAVSGRSATPRIVAEVTDRPQKDVARALSELRSARVLERRIQNGEMQFCFARRTNLEVTQRSISSELTARLHGRWADASSKEPGFLDPSLLAYHQLRSSEPTRGVPLALRAAETHAVAGALEAAVQLLEAALPHAEGEIREIALERLADLSKLRGRPRDALRFVAELKKALPEAEAGKALVREAHLFNQAGEYDRALEAVDAARTVLAPDSLERADGECAAGEALYQLGRLVDASETAASAIDHLIGPAAESVRLRLELCNLLGKIALAADELERALGIFDETFVLAEAHGLPREAARARVNLGLVHMRAGRPVEAEENLCLGIDLAKESHDVSHLAFGLLNLGVLAHQKGQLGRAIECYQQCRSLFLRLGNRTQLARVLYNLGNLYLLLGDSERARTHNTEALRLAKDLGVEKLTALATMLEGMTRAEEGDFEGAEAHLRDSMLLLRRLGKDRPLEAMVELASLQLRRDAPERALEILEELGAGLDHDRNQRLHLRGRLLAGRTRAALGDPSAESVLLEVRQGLELLGERLLLREAELELSRLYERQGQRETARMHMQTALNLQAAIEAELPEGLRVVFAGARTQRESSALLERLERSPEPRAGSPELVSRIERRDSSPSQPPAERAEEWRRRYGLLIGQSPRLYKIFHILDRVASSEDTVLIAGESGTGKELIAEAIHRNSSRAHGPFVKLNCAALVESLLLSELFGHERGSFTGAHQRKVGRFEMAAGGTIFLDEIGDISPKTQVSLLRVLQEKEFERVGGGRPIRLEARVVFATNRNLQQMVREGTFREDLYYRLKGITVETPSLRERSEDISTLAEHFLKRYAEESGTLERALSQAAVDMLRQYRWPGNVRELENVVRSVALFADSPVIDVTDFEEYRELFQDALGFEQPLPAPVLVSTMPSRPTIPPPPPISPTPAPRALAPAPVADVSSRPSDESSLLARIFSEGVPLADLKKRIQDEAIAMALDKSRGNITKAAEMLGMKRPRLSQIINASEELKLLCQGVEK